MKKQILLIFFLLNLIPINNLLAQVGCNTDDRYRNSIFEMDETEVFPIVYANISSDQLWNNGDTLNNNNCFDPRRYLTIQSDGTWDMAMNIYRPKAEFDDCTDRATILFVHGGGYNYAASGMEGDNILDFAHDMVRRGYVVATIQYRKGWDQRAALNSLGLGPLVPGCQNCPCANGNQNCTAFSFLEMNYTMLQDTRAAHRKLTNMADDLGINPSAIFYSGASTGACGIMHAGFAADDMPTYIGENGQSLVTRWGDADVIGEPLDDGLELQLAGVSTISGAITDMEWIENEDNIPLGMIHTTLDEAVQYCYGRILNMRYLQFGNIGEWLDMNGPGRIYKQVRCNSEGTNSLTKIRLTTLQGLYHSFTSPLGSTDPSDNCDAFDSSQEVYSEVARFCADIVADIPIENQHTFVPMAHVEGPCTLIDTVAYTPCTNFEPCDLTNLANVDLSTLSIYPNPVFAGNSILISFDEKINGIGLFDLQGRFITNQFNSESLMIPRTVSPGIYFLKIETPSRSFYKKILIR